jgi:hypothetical protein
VKAIDRRLPRLEDQARPIVTDRGQTPADMLRERRRRRLEAAGLPFEELPQEAFAGAQSLSEAIRMGRKWALESGHTRASTL